MTVTIREPTPAAFSLPDGIETPALIIDLDVVDRNIAAMAAHMAARGVRLRPHVKTHKSVELARRQLDAGATGITVGTIGEAEVMAAAGIEDIFLAYPVWATSAKGHRIRDLHASIEFSVGVDSEDGARRLGESVGRTKRPLRVLVEVDSGERRTGVAGADPAVRVARAAIEAGLEVDGVFTHGGHAYAGPAAVVDAARDEANALSTAAAALREAGVEVREVSAGSTPTARLSATDGVTEERPGTYVLGDRQQVALGSIAPDAVALVVAATVVSAIGNGQVVVDAGAKMLARDRPGFLDGLGVLPALGGAVIERAYDYHGVVSIPPGTRTPRLGEIVAIVPNHVCPVVNLADYLTAVRDGQVEATWRVDARGRNS